jgi:hypothetical protein
MLRIYIARTVLPGRRGPNSPSTNLKENTVKKLTIRFFAGPLALLALATMFLLLPGFAEENHGQKNSQATVHLWDYCDPASFNAALGSGTCDRDTTTGAITVTGFLGEVASDKSAGAWRFSPAEIKSKNGKVALALQNVGGELHTFTRVKKFGGGFVDALNQASGNPVPAPECAQMVNGVLKSQAPGPDNLFIPAGGTATASTPRREDVTRYQCCIHPWMRLVVGGDDDHGHDH